MFKQNYSNSRNRSFGGRSRFGSGRPTGPKRYGGYSGGGGRRGTRTVDVSLLVKRATEGQVEDVYIPKNTFNDFVIADALKQNILEKGFTVLTPIQDEAIPHLLENRDVVGIANTGTGKTAAFLIPLINKIYNNKGKKALIVAPTRELAVQIHQECRNFTRNMDLFPHLCIGGASLYQQKGGLRQNPEIVIGTPGRLKDLYNQRALNFSEYDTIVLDEVDRMLDMGFIHDVKFIVSYLPQNRQSLFFSATLSPNIQGIITMFAKNPVFISVKKQETLSNVDQDVIRTNGREKIDILHELLGQEGFDKVLVFGKTKWGIEKLSRMLTDKGHRVVALHGNKNQNQRQRALDQFKQNRVRVLLATDIASRGLDIPDITHVINFDLPQTYEDYVHRIGRTGRANKKGSAISFVESNINSRY